MNRHLTTAILCTLSGFIAVIAIYGLFELGFRLYASTLPQYKQTRAAGAVNSLQLHVRANSTAQQSYNDAAYYLHPTVGPYDTSTTKLVHDDVLTITPTIQQLIQQASKAPKLPEWVR